MANVVVVDRVPDLRDAIVSALKARSPGTVARAFDEGEEILRALRISPIDVLVVDAGLAGGVDAMTVLLATATRQRSATVLVRVEQGSDEPVANGVGFVTATAADAIVDRVTTLVAAPRSRDATLGELSLLRLLQVAASTDWYGSFAVRDGRRSGVVVVAGGAVTDARYDGDVGDAALERVLRLAGGTITECDPPLDVRKTVTRSTSDILAEAVAYWASGAADQETELDADELVDFLGGEEKSRRDAIELFSAAELREMALDDSMAIPLPGGMGGGRGGR